MVNDNSAEHSLALFHPSLAFLRERSLNMFFLQTPEHYIQIMVPFKLAGVELAAVSIIGLNPKDKENYHVETRHEENLVKVIQDRIGADISLSNPNLNVQFKRTEDISSFIKVDSSSAQFSLEAVFDGTHQSSYWVTPLTEDKTTDFETWKRAGIPLQPFNYTFKGKEYKCGERECLLTTDQFRGHHNYGMQFYFATL